MYCEREDVGLGFIPAIGVMAPGTSSNILTDPRFSATRFGLPGGTAAPAPAPAPIPKKAPEPVKEKAAAPPPPQPSSSDPVVSSGGEVPAPFTSSTGGGEYTLALPGGPANAAPGNVNVTLEATGGAAPAGKGFGMVEAAIAAGLAALLASTWSKKKR